MVSRRPLGLDKFTAFGRKPRTKTTTRRQTVATGRPEIDALNSKLNTAGATRISGLQDMENHPGVKFSRQMAAGGVAAGPIAEITGDVHGRLGEQGIYRTEDGTWKIDMGKNSQYREGRRNSITSAVENPGSSPVPSRPIGDIARTVHTENTPPTVRPAPSRPVNNIVSTVHTENTPRPAPTQPAGPLTTPGHQQTSRAIPPAVSSNPLQVPGHQQTGRATPLGQSATAPGSSGGFFPPGGPQPVAPPPAPMTTGGGVPANTGFFPPSSTGGSSAPSSFAHPGMMQKLQAVGTTTGGNSAPRYDQQQTGRAIAPQSPLQAPGHQQTGRAIQPVSVGGSSAQRDPSQIPGHQQTGRAVQPQGTNIVPTVHTENTAPGGGQPPVGGPGNVPRQTTPAGPTRPTLPPGFGSPGPTQIPQNRGLGFGGLAGLGDRIEQTVHSRIQGSPMPGRPGMPGQQPNIPQPTIPGLGQSTNSIRDSVMATLNQRLGQRGQIATPTAPTAPAPPGTTGGTQGPGTGITGQPPVTPGGQPPVSPGPQPQPPTGGGGTLGSYGNPTIDQWDSAFIAAGNKYGVDPTLLKAMMDIETGGDGNYSATQCRGSDGYDNVPACGPMQIKWEYHASKCPECDPNTVEGQIMMAAAILDDGVKNQGYATHRDALFGIYFPGDDVNGTTQGSYGARVDELQAQMGPYTPGGPATPTTTPAGGPLTTPGHQQTGRAIDPTLAQQENLNTPPPPGADQTAPIGPTGAGGLRGPVVSNNVAVTTPFDGMGLAATPDSDESWMLTAFPNGSSISTEYKQQVTWEVPQLGSCPYCYQNGHGADGTTHAGMDITGNYDDPVATPVAGTVVCSGYGQGNGGSDFRCDYAIGQTFEDNNGAGQITLDVGTDAAGNQLLINTIHMGGSSVQPGQQLQPGDQIGTMGSMGGMVHTHIEGLAMCNGNYIYLDPTLVYNGYYNNHNACEGY